MATWTDQDENTGGGGVNTFLLQEDGFDLLLEDGGRIILLEGIDPTPIWTDQTKN